MISRSLFWHWIFVMGIILMLATTCAESKHNNGVAIHMPALLRDLPIHRSSVIYNWRQIAIITRNGDGTIALDKVIYQTKGFAFYG